MSLHLKEAVRLSAQVMSELRQYADKERAKPHPSACRATAIEEVCDAGEDFAAAIRRLVACAERGG